MPKISCISTIFTTTTFIILLLLHIFDLSQCTDYSLNKISRIAAPYQNSRSAQRDVPDSTSDSDGPDNQKFFGSSIEIKDYDTSEFNYIGGGPVRTGDELSTDFSAPSCWSPNTSSQKLKWKSAHNKPESKKLNYYFNTGNGPDNDYMVAYSRTKVSPNDYAVFESCSIMCAKGPVTVSLKYWASEGVILELCNREVFFEDGEPGDCKKLPQQNQPGPAKISMTLKELSAVIVKASNFIDEKGSVAMIDDMEVDYTPCEDTTPAPIQYTSPLSRLTPGGQQPSSPEYDSPDTCQNVVCSFDQNLCSYTNMDFTSSTKQNSRLFAPHRGRYRNLLTGIREGPQGSQTGYASAYLLRQEIAGIESGPVEIKEDRVLQMYLYEATQGMTTRVCFNHDLNCPYRTQGVVQKDERKWKLMYWPVPKGTKKILLIAENKGPNEGAVGFSSLRLLAAPMNGGDPQTATRSTCLTARALRTFSRL